MRRAAPARFIEGLRVTDEETMEYVAMALSRGESPSGRGLERGGPGQRRTVGRRQLVAARSALGAPWGRVGGSAHGRCRAHLSTSWRDGLTPVVSPIAVDDCGRATSTATPTASRVRSPAALDARALVLLSDVDQLRSDPSTSRRLSRA